MKKKMIAVLLSVLMILTTIPFTGVAAFATASGDFEYEILSETGKTCAIADYNGAAKNLVIPSEIDGYKVTTIFDTAFSTNKDLISVTMPNTVTDIYNSIFEGCTSLESVTLSNSLTVIPWFTFSGCTSLKNITIPSGITGIGRFAFRDCVSLTEIVIPESVTSIDEGVFYNCTSLTSITIPDSTTTIGSRAFANTAYYNNQSNWDNDVLYIGNHLIEAKNTLSGAYSIRPGTVSIPQSAFSDCTALSDITIPDSVTSIGAWAFLDTAYYNDAANWDNGVLYIGNHLIEAKDTLSGAYIIRLDTVSIADYAFDFCTSLTSINIPDSVVNIGDSTFKDCDSLVGITIPDSVTSIGDSTFTGCNSLVDITIPDSVTSIGYRAFSYCTSLTNVTLPNSIKSIDGYAFEECRLLTAIAIPNGITNIGKYAFWGCTALKSVTIPASVTAIGENALGLFIDSDGYTVPVSGFTIYGEEGTAAEQYTVSNGLIFIPLETCFDYKILSETDKTCEITGYTGTATDINIPETIDGYTVTSIGDSAFSSCSALESIIIPDSVTSIGLRAFYGTAYYNNPSNWENDVLYIGNHLIEAKKTLSGTYAVRSGTKTIAECAFSGCSDITEIVFPDGLQVICDGAFEDSSVTKAYFPESLKIIGDNAFSYCRNLKQVKFPKQMEYIGKSAFHLTRISGDIIIPEGVKDVSTSFGRCASIKTLTVPASVTDIGILEMQSLTDIFVSENNENYSSIDGVLFDKSATMLIKYPHGKTQDTYIVPNGVKKICGHAIGDESNGYGGHEYLRNIVLPESLETIEDRAIISFNLKSVTISANTKSIASNAIVNCDSSINPLSFTVYGYSGTEAQLYAEAQNYPFVALVSYADKATDIQVYTNEQTDSAFAQNTALNISVKESSNTKIVYDISFTQNGETIQPASPVTVKIPVPASMNSTDCKVYRQEADGTYTDMNAVYQDGYMVFTTDHFSVYVITTDDPNKPDVLLGDMDGNGEVDDWDSVLLDRYLAGWDVQADASIADIDQNGIVDDWDGVLLSRNLAGWK